MFVIQWRYSKILKAGKGFTCGRGTKFYAKNQINIGNDVFFGRYCNIECDCDIGHEVLIANNVGFVGKIDHDYKKVGAPMRFSPAIRDAGYSMPIRKSKIVIGDDVWIGYGATLLSGINIGSGSIVAACSLITQDVEPFSIVAGVPARKVGMRFDELTIEKHKNKCRLNYSSYKI